MNKTIEKYAHIVVQIATTQSNGTGFYLPQYDLIITNYHVVSENIYITIHGKQIPRQRALVVYKDSLHDLAFIKVNLANAHFPAVELIADELVLEEGDPIVAIGHPFGLKYTATKGILSKVKRQYGALQYLQIDAAINPGNSGGPLINQIGEIIGVNTFIIEGGDNVGFALPVRYLKRCLNDYADYDTKRIERCASCENLVEKNEAEATKCYCPHCGNKLVFANEIDYLPSGTAKIIENILEQLEKDPVLARQGINTWVVKHGSAVISINFDPNNGLIMADARLCRLPKTNIAAIYEFILRENYTTEKMVFSVKEQYIVLSFVAYDRYISPENAWLLFKELFQKADYYDNVLVETYGAIWATPEDDS